MSKKISFFGDILVDLVQNDGGFFPQAGGSIFNTAMTVAKNGYDVNFVSQIGNDYWGSYLLNVCRSLNICTDNIYQSDKTKTSLAFAIVDECGNAKYDFYKSQEPHDFEPQSLSGSALFHFGSTFSLMPHNQDNLIRFITFCRENGILISYDPNCRPNSDVDKMKQWCRMADIVKMSEEDMKYIYPDMPVLDGAMTILSNGAKLVVVTFGKYGAMAWTAESIGCAKCPPTDKMIRHTIGAGDNFTAGMIDYIIGNDIADLSSLDEEQLSQLCSAGNTAALKHLTNG
ncbi:MAG: hypothetical protein J6W76_00540 [Spirochaetales bacterium]|nr:hypothetical protein [Spirochaetales bacterium]